MDAIRVAVVSWTRISDDDLRRGIGALQEQVHRDLAPAWGVDAELVVVPAERGTTWPGHWGLVLLDRNLANPTTDQSEALGAYDDHMTSDGHPLAPVSLQQGVDWTHTASHELLEMLVDPDGNGAVQRPSVASSASSGRLYMRRVCDPCAAVSQGYRRGGCLVSDFVYPAWFGSRRPGPGGRLDHRGHTSEPFEVLTGGSIAYIDVGAVSWQTMHGVASPAEDPLKSVWPP